jgi:hypothetical protein
MGFVFLWARLRQRAKVNDKSIQIETLSSVGTRVSFGVPVPDVPV